MLAMPSFFLFVQVKSGDSVLQQNLSSTDIIQEEKKKPVLNASLRELNDGSLLSKRLKADAELR